jgi:magnesium chelatase family protein
VLFLDELPEFGSRMLEMLRQPLDPAGKVVSISRSAGETSRARGNFILVGSMNPCPCGFYTDPDPQGRAPARSRWGRATRSGSPVRCTSGRIDIHIEVPRVPLVPFGYLRS